MAGPWKHSGWIAVAATFTVNFFGDGFIFSFGILLVEFLDTFHQSHAETALIGSIMNGVAHLIGPIAGPICDATGSRGVVMVGSVLSAAGVFASYFVSSVPWMYATFGVLGGAGIGLMITAANACVMKHFTHKRALASGIALCGSGAGTFLMNQLTACLITQYGWRQTMLITSGLLLNGLVCGLLLQEPERPRPDCKIDKQSHTAPDSRLKRSNDDPKRLQSDCKINTKPHTNPDSRENRSNAIYKKSFVQAVVGIFDLSLLLDIRCTSFLLSSVFVNLGFSIPFSFLPDQASKLGIPYNKASWLVSTIGIGNTVSRVLFGFLGDRKCVNRFYMLEALILLTGISLALSPLLTTFETKLMFASSYGILIGGYIMLVPVVLTDLFGADIIGKALGLNRFADGISALIAPALVGLIFDHSGSYTLAFLFAGIEIIMAGVVLLIPIFQRRCSRKIYTVNSPDVMKPA